MFVLEDWQFVNEFRHALGKFHKYANVKYIYI